MSDMNHYYLKLDGVEGDSTDPAHKGWIEVEAIQFGNSRSAISGGSGGTSRSQVQEIIVVSKLGNQSASLFRATATGQEFATGVVEFVQGTGATASVKLKVQLTDVMLGSFHPGSGNPPLDSYSLNFAEIHIDYGTPPQGPQTVDPAYWNLIRSASATNKSKTP